jgi:hypothetical protein
MGRKSMTPDGYLHNGNCWCGLDHARMDIDQDGNWFELPDEEDD